MHASHFAYSIVVFARIFSFNYKDKAAPLHAMKEYVEVKV